MASQRMDQINSLLHQRLGALIAREVEFTGNAIVTLVRVKTSADLSVCKVWIAVVPTVHTRAALSSLIQKARMLEQALSRDIHLKKIPRLLFLSDDTGEKALEMEKILDDLQLNQRD